jgi:hypothetical protein
MKLAKAELLLAALVFLTFGFGFLIVPVQWAAVVDILLPTPMGRTDFRATYGGFEIGMGVFLAACALREHWLRPGLVALAWVAAGFGAGRLVGIVVEGTASSLMLLFVVLEWTIAFVTLYLLRRLPLGSGEVPG